MPILLVDLFALSIKAVGCRVGTVGSVIITEFGLIVVLAVSDVTTNSVYSLPTESLLDAVKGIEHSHDVNESLNDTTLHNVLLPSAKHLGVVST
jgi:hypothetical protein